MGSVRTSILEDLDTHPGTDAPPGTTPSSAKSLVDSQIAGDLRDGFARLEYELHCFRPIFGRELPVLSHE